MFVPVNIGRDGKQGRPPRKRPPRKKQTAKDGVHSGVTHFCARCGNQAELIWVSRKGKVRKIQSSRSGVERTSDTAGTVRLDFSAGDNGMNQTNLS